MRSTTHWTHTTRRVKELTLKSTVSNKSNPIIAAAYSGLLKVDLVPQGSDLMHLYFNHIPMLQECFGPAKRANSFGSACHDCRARWNRGAYENQQRNEGLLTRHVVLP